MLDLKRLRVLGEVARQGSFSAAAEALYLSQSAVSQQVATLEGEVGMPLLERTRNGPKLNAAGKALVRHAEAALARLEEAEHELKAIAGLEGGELRIASFASASATLLTEALGEFSGRHPEVRLVMRDGKTIRARRLNEDTFSIQLIDEQGRLQSIMKTDVREYEILKASPMPAYQGKLSTEEVADLVAYLLSLRG